MLSLVLARTKKNLTFGTKIMSLGAGSGDCTREREQAARQSAHWGATLPRRGAGTQCPSFTGSNAQILTQLEEVVQKRLYKKRLSRLQKCRRYELY